MAPMQKSRMNFAATVLDGTIYAFGGVNERKLTTSSIERYVDGAWQLMDVSMPMQMASPGAVVDDGKIILVGGRMG